LFGLTFPSAACTSVRAAQQRVRIGIAHCAACPLALCKRTIRPAATAVWPSSGLQNRHRGAARRNHLSRRRALRPRGFTAGQSPSASTTSSCVDCRRPHVRPQRPPSECGTACASRRGTAYARPSPLTPVCWPFSLMRPCRSAMFVCTVHDSAAPERRISALFASMLSAPNAWRAFVICGRCAVDIRMMSPAMIPASPPDRLSTTDITITPRTDRRSRVARPSHPPTACKATRQPPARDAAVLAARHDPFDGCGRNEQ